MHAAQPYIGLAVARCCYMNNRSMCALAEHLWIEHLDLSYCTHITDDGICILALEFAGLRSLDVSRCCRLTDRCLEVLSVSCSHLSDLWAVDCPLITAAAAA